MSNVLPKYTDPKRQDGSDSHNSKIYSENTNFLFFHPNEWLWYSFIYICPEFRCRSWLNSLSSNTYPICQTCYLQLCRISSVRHYLTHDALICTFILSHIYYCNSLLAGCPQNMICKLQKVQNKAARLSRSVRCDHILSPILHALHWLPVESRI